MDAAASESQTHGDSRNIQLGASNGKNIRNDNDVVKKLNRVENASNGKNAQNDNDKVRELNQVENAQYDKGTAQVTSEVQGF